MKQTIVASLLVVLLCAAASASEESATPYKSTPAIVEKLKALGPRCGLMLGTFKVLPKDVGKYHGSLKKGPGRRNFCNKIAYAPDRETGVYCGANHNSPHRLNDVWEFHLGSNTWHLISPPGTNATKLRDLMKLAKKAGKNEEEAAKVRERIKAWYTRCTIKDGFLQAKSNGGPIRPFHTWDGVTYDEKTRRLYWAVLDLSHEHHAKGYAASLGLDVEKEIAKLKPASTMYMYDLEKKRWFRQLGEKPFPRMHGMGGSLVYLPDLDKTIWYIVAQNRTPNDIGMWSYDAKKNAWKELISFKDLRAQAFSKKNAPGCELQLAYSPKHKKIVAVQGKTAFIYDVEKSKWTAGAKTQGYGHDAHSVFAYDSNADIFLLVSKPTWRGSKDRWGLHAYDLKTDKWETVKIKGTDLPDDTKAPGWRKCSFAGYYDTKANVLVLYEGRHGRTWVYRHAKSVDTAE